MAEGSDDHVWVQCAGSPLLRICCASGSEAANEQHPSGLPRDTLVPLREVAHASLGQLSTWATWLIPDAGIHVLLSRLDSQTSLWK